MITPADIDELEALGKEAVPHTGHCTIVEIVKALRRGDRRTAEIVYENDGDKLWGYAKVRAKVKSMLGCRMHLAHNCQSWLCKRIEE